MPDVIDRFAQHGPYRVITILFAIRSWKYDNTKLHLISLASGLLPNNPVLLDDRVRQNFFGQPLDLSAVALVLDIEDLSLPDVGDIGKSNRSEAAMNRHALRIETCRLQRHN